MLNPLSQLRKAPGFGRSVAAAVVLALFVLALAGLMLPVPGELTSLYAAYFHAVGISLGQH
jgi:hypothetical protein